MKSFANSDILFVEFITAEKIELMTCIFIVQLMLNEMKFFEPIRLLYVEGSQHTFKNSVKFF